MIISRQERRRGQRDALKEANPPKLNPSEGPNRATRRKAVKTRCKRLRVVRDKLVAGEIVVIKKLSRFLGNRKRALKKQ